MTDVMQTEGDPVSSGWECGTCTLVNSPARPGCFMCGTERPANYKVSEEDEKKWQEEQNKKIALPDPGQGSAGWMCGTCTFVNSAGRPGCSMCGAQRPENYKASEEEERKWMEQQNAKEAACIVQTTLSMVEGDANTGMDFWNCSVCTYLNTAISNVCVICGAAMPEQYKRQDTTNHSLLPAFWTPMNPEDICVLVDVNIQSEEYREISAHFLRENPRNITKIQRVQNPYLREMYERRKMFMMKVHGKTEEEIERRLFHGTAAANFEAITHRNFDWRFHGSRSGRQSFGRGVYFALHASYSLKYASKNQMFVAKVLVVNVIQGNKGIIQLPALPGNPRITFDTSVDDVQDPYIFVKYNDQEMYPEYIVTSTKLPAKTL